MSKPRGEEVDRMVEAVIFSFCPFVHLSWSSLVSITPSMSCAGLALLTTHAFSSFP